MFVYQTDRVQCVFCRGYLRNWEHGDVANQEHRRHFAECPYMCGHNVGNIPDPSKVVLVQQQHNGLFNLTETDVRNSYIGIDIISVRQLFTITLNIFIVLMCLLEVNTFNIFIMTLFVKVLPWKFFFGFLRI